MHSISVIITHHNRLNLLGEAIESVRKQTIQPIEIIVVDDGSRPDVRRELSKFTNIATILHTPRNVGASAARNYGATRARGSLLAFLDDDDLFLRDRLKMGIRYLEENPSCDAVGGGLMMQCGTATEYWGEKLTRTVTLAESFVNTASMLQSLLVTRQSFWRIGGLDRRLRYLDDYDFGIRFVGSGFRMDFVAEPFFVYRLGASEHLTNHWMSLLWEQVRIIHRHRTLCRRAFGRLGTLKLYGRHCRLQGLSHGGLRGRAIWLLGLVCKGIAGDYSSPQSAASPREVYSLTATSRTSSSSAIGMRIE